MSFINVQIYYSIISFSLIVAYLDAMPLLKVSKHSFQPPPYGECGSKALDYFPTYTRENCLEECNAMHMEKICGCKLFYMPGTAKMCNLQEMVTCQTILRFPPNDSCKLADSKLLSISSHVKTVFCKCFVFTKNF